MTHSNRQHTEQGFSLPEILIATAILLIIMAGVAYFITNQKTVAIKVSNSAECASLTQTLLTHYTSNQATLNVENLIPNISSQVRQLKLKIFLQTQRELLKFKLPLRFQPQQDHNPVNKKPALIFQLISRAQQCNLFQ